MIQNFGIIRSRSSCRESETSSENHVSTVFDFDNTFPTCKHFQVCQDRLLHVCQDRLSGLYASVFNLFEFAEPLWTYKMFVDPIWQIKKFEEYLSNLKQLFAEPKLTN